MKKSTKNKIKKIQSNKKKRKTRRKIQKGGLDPLLGLPKSIDNFDYSNFKKTKVERKRDEEDDLLRWEKVDSAKMLIKNDQAPFILDKNRRDWIGNFYPYAPYFIDGIKNIHWNNFMFEKNENGIDIKIKLGNSVGQAKIPPYCFYGGCAMELYNKEMELLLSKKGIRDFPKLHDFAAPTADIDVHVYLIINIVSDKIPDLKSEYGIRFSETFLEFIKENKNVFFPFLNKNKIFNQFASFFKKEIEPSVNSFNTKYVSSLPVQLKIEEDRINIISSITNENGIYADHLVEVIPEIIVYMGKTWFPIEELESYLMREKADSKEDEEGEEGEEGEEDEEDEEDERAALKKLYNLVLWFNSNLVSYFYKNYYTEKGYILRSMFRELERNSQLVPSTSPQFGSHVKKRPLFITEYDKVSSRLKRLEYILYLITFLNLNEYNDVLNKIMTSYEITRTMDTYIKPCVENSSNCLQFYVSLVNDDEHIFDKIFNVKTLVDNFAPLIRS